MNEKFLRTDPGPAVLLLDFDGTLIKGDCIRPILRSAGIDEDHFWSRVSSRTNADTPAECAYLHELADSLNLLSPGFKLADLALLARDLAPNPGAPESLRRFKGVARQLGVDLQVGILSSAPRQMIENSPFAPFVDFIVAADLGRGPGGSICVADVLSAEGKGDFIRNIPRGGATINLPPIPGRRVVYLADGATDIPAFCAVTGGGGKVLQIFEEGDAVAWKRAWLIGQALAFTNFIAPANFVVGTLADFWMRETIGAMAAEAGVAR